MGLHLIREQQFIYLTHIFSRSRNLLRLRTNTQFTCSRSFTAQKPVWPYIYSSKRITMAPQLDAYFKQVDNLSEHFIDRLRSAVAIPSVSADEERRQDVVKVKPPPKLRPHVLTQDRSRWVNSSPANSKPSVHTSN